jgi:hypothetical protein
VSYIGKRREITQRTTVTIIVVLTGVVLGGYILGGMLLYAVGAGGKQPPRQVTFRNDLTVGVILERLEPAPSAAWQLGPGESLTATEPDAFYDVLRDLRHKEGIVLTLLVREASGQVLGRIALTSSFLFGYRGYTVCLSAAKEPSYIVHDNVDVPDECAFNPVGS